MKLSIIESAGINKVSAHTILKELVDHDILKVIIPGKARRPTIYSFPKLLDITDRLDTTDK